MPQDNKNPATCLSIAPERSLYWSNGEGKPFFRKEVFTRIQNEKERKR